MALAASRFPQMESLLLPLRYMAEGQESVFDRVLRELVESERVINGRNQKTTMTIVDSKTIQNTDTAEEKGYDAGKKNLE